jgi:Ni/Fe-hydrogenase subunit HybB-like protein
MKLNLRVSEQLRCIDITRGMGILIVLILLGVAFALVRFASGIGAISDLSNRFPWGFWISFDLYCGVALGAGAFVIVATVEILRLKQFEPLLRPSILTGFLGYLMVIIALLVDLGQPLRIWHLMIYQNYTSVLFEVGVCVMLYTAVLTIEFAPVFLEGIKLPKIAHTLHRFSMPFVILGVVLSTLHQSSLGSMLLIQATRLHPLWWTPILPVMFFISAVGVGLGIVILESSLSSRAFKRGLEVHILKKLAVASVVVEAIYLVLKFGDLAAAGELNLLFSSGAMSVLFWAEIIVGAVIPIILFSQRAVRESSTGLLVGSLFVVAGLILNRFNVSWFAIQRVDPITYVPSFMGKVTYFPTLPEVAVSIGIVSAGVLAFTLAAKYLPLFEDGHHEIAGHAPQASAAAGD